MLSTYKKNIIINVFSWVRDMDDNLRIQTEEDVDWSFMARKDMFACIVSYLNDTGVLTKQGKRWTQRRWRDFCLSLRNDKDDVISVLADVGIYVGGGEDDMELGYKEIDYVDLRRWKTESDWVAKRTGALTKGDERMDERYVEALVVEDRRWKAERQRYGEGVSKTWSHSLGQNTRQT